MSAPKRHPMLIARDKGYAEAEKNRHPQLVDDGAFYVDPMPLMTDLIGLRPLTIEEQVARFTAHGLTDFGLVPDEKFLSEDDFHDYLDDLPEEGLTPHEYHGFENILRVMEFGRDYTSPERILQGDYEDDPIPPPEGEAEAPQKATKAKPSSADEAE